MNRSICFLDRDGTINVNTGYPHKTEELQLLPRAAEAIRLLNENSIMTVVVTNQSGVGRGYFGLEQLHAFNDSIAHRLSEQDAAIEKWLYCPHHPDDGCNCRKPAVGMVDCLSVEIENADELYMIGDSVSDVGFGLNIGAKVFYIGQVQDLDGMFPQRAERVVIVTDLFAAVQHIVNA